MSTSDNTIGPDTNFSNITITNNYPVLTGGTWYAYVKDGKTLYGQGTTVYEGPVNIIGANLVIEAGAVVDGIVIAGGSGNTQPSVTVQDGGTITNSNVFNGSITIAAGGLSQNNNYVAENVTFANGSKDSKATSIGDNFYIPGSAKTGTLVASGSKTTFNVSGGGSSISSGTYAVIQDSNFPDISANNPSAGNAANLSFSVSQSSSFGASYDRPIPNYNNYNITNDYPVLTGETWWAYPDATTGKTMYGQGNNIYEGPVNLVNITQLVVQPGAVVDGIWMFGTTNPTVTVQNGGIIQNSHIFNGYTVVESGGVSTGNEYVSQVVTLNSGGTSINDYFYESGSGITGKFVSTNTNSNGYSINFYTGDGTASVTASSGSTWTNYHVKTGASSTIPIVIGPTANVSSCFLAGALIDTIDGRCKVEDIQIGDFIKTYDWHNQSYTCNVVTWVGKSNKVIDKSVSDDEAGYPVRVLKDAIADNVPCEDLLVTPEHCLFFDNKFIPVRMLVNGSSIFYDKSFSTYDYYHIKTKKHSVICANNVLTESFLDTKYYSDFVRKQDVVSITSGIQTWENDAAAPLVVARDIVEPIFRDIEARAVKNNLICHVAKSELVNDITIHLITDKKRLITKVRNNNNQFVFIILAGVTSVRILSKSSRPSEVVGPFVDDRRSLGVLVGKIMIFDKQQVDNLDTHLTDNTLSGWHSIESNLYRWTKGNAILPLTRSNQVRVLSINVVAAGPYIKSVNNMVDSEIIPLQKAS